MDDATRWKEHLRTLCVLLAPIFKAYTVKHFHDCDVELYGNFQCNCGCDASMKALDEHLALIQGELRAEQKGMQDDGTDVV